MKLITLVLFFLVTNVVVKSQNNFEVICASCDSMAVRHCGEYKKVEYEKIDKRKLKRDLKTIFTVESYLLDTTSSNLVIDSHYRIIYLKNVSDSIRKIEKRILLNYFEIYLYEFFYEGTMFKYAGIINKNTVYCKLNWEKDPINEFDKRLIKPLLNNRKSKYAFLGCRALYLNYLGTLYIPKKVIKPIKLQENIFEPNKQISDYFK